jgi:hypothetical protein
MKNEEEKFGLTLNIKPNFFVAKIFYRLTYPGLRAS